MLMTAGAEVGPAKYPIASPIVQKGSEPETRVSTSLAATNVGMCTPPKATPKVRSARTSTVLNITLITTLARKYA